MWYFAWVLGVSFAAALAILNAMWLETVCDIDAGARRDLSVGEQSSEG